VSGQTIITTECPLTAALFGYDRPCNFRDDGEGFQARVEFDATLGPIFTLNGPDGEITLYRNEAIELAKQIMASVGTADRMAARVLMAAE
jgi:hypothetical protein